MRVLVIDDDLHIQRIVEDRLKAENFEILKASDGIEGLRMVYDFHPDVVLLDIMMPTIDGTAVLHCIKKDDKIKNIPIIMMTAKRERADVMQAAAAGAAEYIVKPIDFRQMVKKIYEVTHAAPPKPREKAGPLNIKAMATDLANLSFEMEAIAASAGIKVERPLPETKGSGLNIKVDTAPGGVACLQFGGALHTEDADSIRSELTRLIAANVSKFVVDISDIQSLDLTEVMILKDVMNLISRNQYAARLVETDGKRRRFLRQCNLHLEYTLFDSRDEALRSF